MSDIAIARKLLEKSMEFAEEAANIASAVPVDKPNKEQAEDYERIGDHVADLISSTLNP